MLKLMLRGLMLKSPTFRVNLANYRKRQRESKVDKSWAKYFAAGGTVRREPKRGY